MRVGFSKPKRNSLFSYLIRKFLGTEYSHTYIVSQEVALTNQELVFHADGRGVYALDYETFKYKNLIIEEIEIPTSSEAIHYCITKLGRPYSILTLVSILLGIRIKDGPNRFICSELVARALSVELENHDLLTPKDIKEYLTREKI